MTSLNELFEDAVDPRTSMWDLNPQKRAEAAGIAEGQNASTEQFAVYGRHASTVSTLGEFAATDYVGRHRLGFWKGLLNG